MKIFILSLNSGVANIHPEYESIQNSCFWCSWTKIKERVTLGQNHL